MLIREKVALSVVGVKFKGLCSGTTGRQGAEGGGERAGGRSVGAWRKGRKGVQFPLASAAQIRIVIVA